MNKTTNGVLMGAALAALGLGTVGLAEAAATKAVGHIPKKFEAFLSDWETGMWRVKQEGCFVFYWSCYQSQNSYNAGVEPKWPLPFTPAARAFHDKVIKSLQEGNSIYDPNALCLPQGMPDLARSFTGFKMVLQPDRIYFIYPDYDLRVIWMDGRQMPKRELDEYAYNGDSLGHWEGDTLVIYTANIKGDPELKGDVAPGISPNEPKSNEFTMTERLTPLSADLMDVKITFEDKVMFTGPYTESFQYARNAKEDLPQQPAACLLGVGQRYVPDPETGAQILSGPGGAPLQDAED
ncbi:MAG: hypothetical protein QM696_11985 [Steroidobacteraceae bacterium]